MTATTAVAKRKKDLIVEIPGLVPDTVKIALREDLTISEDLGREVDQTAAQFGYYAVLAEKAEARFQMTKLAFDLWRAKTEDVISAEYGPFKTVKELDRKVMQLAKWRSFKTTLIEFEEHARILKQVAKAFEIKVNLVQTKNANRRKELA